MSNIRTISGIPDEIWSKFGEKHKNKSKRIKELIKEDLDYMENNPGELPTPTPIQDADLTSTQRKAVKELLENGVTEKNDQQFRRFMDRFYSQADHIRDFKHKIDGLEDIPYRVENGGLKSEKVDCKGCEASYNVKALMKLGFNCKKCGLQVLDV